MIIKDDNVRNLRINLYIDQFVENLDSYCAVRLLVVVTFKSCDRDVVCL